MWEAHSVAGGVVEKKPPGVVDVERQQSCFRLHSESNSPPLPFVSTFSVCVTGSVKALMGSILIASEHSEVRFESGGKNA